jgi:hypothetical protein
MSYINGGSISAQRILPLDEHKWLWIVDENTLYVGDSDNPVRQVDTARPVFLMPLLESSPEQFSDSLRSTSMQLYGDERLAAILPLKEIIGEAVKGRSDYWVGLALSWIDALGAADFVELLDALSTASWAPQSIRHHAKRLLRSAH